MRPNGKGPKGQTEDNEQGLRRSNRQRKEPKNDCYLMGSDYLEQILGCCTPEDDFLRRNKRSNRFDDSDDYEEGYRAYHKKAITANKFKALLEWKDRLGETPETKMTLQCTPNKSEEESAELQQGLALHRIKTTKNVVTQNLAALASNIEAIFINIDWGKKGQTMKDFHNLKIDKLMTRGLAFVWAPKEILSDLFKEMQAKGFVYVENLEIINLDIDLARTMCGMTSSKHAQNGTSTSLLNEGRQDEVRTIVNLLDKVDPSELIAAESSTYFNKSKRTLMMFRKISEQKLQLRHQRTCDVVFDMPLNKNMKCTSDIKNYIYSMIETLLPDCLVVRQIKKNEFGLKMMELWADKDHPRRGWISVVQE